MTLTMALILLVSTNTCSAFLFFWIGRAIAATLNVEERMSEGDDASESKSTPRKRRVTGVQWLSMGVVIIGLVVAVLGFQVTRSQDRIVGCVVGYSNASSAAFKARTKAQNEVNEKIDAFFDAVLQAFSSAPEDAQKLIFDTVKAYKDKRTEQKEAQEKNPLPDPPEDACSELLD